jgi:DNA helicase-2/ATP-dependent DNA helicase PcrA
MRTGEGKTLVATLPAYLRVALNPADDLAVLRALDCPPRPALRADPTFRARLEAAAAGGSLMHAVGSLGWATGYEQVDLTCFAAQVARLADAVRSSLWDGVFLGIIGALAEDLAGLGLHTRAADARWLGMLVLDFQRGGVGKRAQKTAAGFLWWATHGQGAGEHDADVDAVTLSTVHLAKGLEWPIVFLPGMTERTFPSAQSLDAAALGRRRALDEELRVFFVACTRAADSLVLTSSALVHPAFGGLPFRASPSRFLAFAQP